MAKDLKRILYVEDEVDIQTIVVTVLETIGNLTVICCGSGPEAIAAAPGADADLILLDVMMPGMDGPTTLNKLREIPQTSVTPVIFMTAKVQAREIEHFKSLGALDVIRKPFDPMTLPDEILKIWRRGAAVQEPKAEAGTEDGPVPSPPQNAQNVLAQPADLGLEELNRRYAADIPAAIEKIGDLWRQLMSGRDPSALEALHRALHSMAGSAEIFGFAELGSRARDMELALVPYLQGTGVPAAMLESLSSMLAALKRAALAPDQSTGSAPVFDHQVKGKPRVIVIDDDANLRDLLRIHLSAIGLTVDVFEDAVAGIRSILQHHPDLIMLDLLMPGMGGLEVLQAVKGDIATKHIPVVVLTGRTDDNTFSQARALGADAFLTKPVRTDALADCVLRLLEKSGVH